MRIELRVALIDAKIPMPALKHLVILGFFLLMSALVQADCILPTGAVPEFPKPENFKHLTRNKDGTLRFTKAFLNEKLDWDVIHGVVREIGSKKWIVEAVIDNTKKMLLSEGRFEQKKVKYTVQIDETTQINNRQKYEDFEGPNHHTQWLCPDNLKAGDIVIIFSAPNEKILLGSSFKARVIMKQNEPYRDLIKKHFHKYGVEL